MSPGVLRLARVQAASRSRGPGRRHPDAVSPWRECPRARAEQVRQPARALDDHGVGVERAAVSARQCPQCGVSCRLWQRWQTPETAWDCGGGAHGTDCALALLGDWGAPGGSGAQNTGSAVAMCSHTAALVLVEAPVKIPGLLRKPSERWGGLLQAFPLTSTDAERIG
jgi:hypothetical protein